MEERLHHKPYQNVSPRLVMVLYASALICSGVYYAGGKYFLDFSLTYLEVLTFTSVLAVTVVGCYQLFFWTQHHNKRLDARCYKTWLDDHIPYIPHFVWVYSLLYYLMIGGVIMTMESAAQGLHYLFGGIVLVSVQCTIFYFHPAVVPEGWRKPHRHRSHMKFLGLVQTFDIGRNCMPSMHMSVATYVCLLLSRSFGPAAFIFDVAIGISCLFVKQHTILDLFPGVFMGWLIYTLVI